MSSTRSAGPVHLAHQPLVARVFTTRGTGMVLTSIGLHMLLIGTLGFMPSPETFFARAPVEMEIVEPEPPPAAPPPPPEAPAI